MKPYVTKSIIPQALSVSLLCVLLLTGCAGPDKAQPARQAAAPVSSATPPPNFPSVSFEHPMSPVGDMLRLFGEQTGGGVVLMNGLEERAAEAVTFRNKAYEQAVSVFAGAIDCIYVYMPHYYLIMPEGYEILQETRLSSALDARYRTMRASVSFGAKTHLYNVFAALSRNLEITIVADNFIAEARCGELFLNDVSMDVIIEAVLQSARVTADTFIVESTPEYIFLRAPQNTAPSSIVLNASALDAARLALLDRQVSLILPDRNAHAFAEAPITLREALLPLTEQLGVEVVAHRTLADIPVNPCAMYQVRLGTALDLLIRQWPLPEFGYEVQADRILIRER